MTPVSPTSAFGSIQPITDTFSTGAAGGVGGATGATGGINFSDALAKVQDSLDSADQLSQQLATGQLQNQLASPAAGPIDPLRIQAALEAIGRIAVQVEFAGRGADRNDRRSKRN